MQEIAALTPKQQRKWKGIMIDEIGTRTGLRYSNGKLESYSVRVHKWVPCVCCEEIFKDRPGTKIEPRSRVGLAAVVEVNSGIDGLIERTMDHAREENHTGNHYRNHKIKVPTGLSLVGQPPLHLGSPAHLLDAGGSRGFSGVSRFKKGVHGTPQEPPRPH